MYDDCETERKTFDGKIKKIIFGYTENYIRGVIKNYSANNDKGFFWAIITGYDREINCAIFEQLT